jgi:hypothetical protein
LTIDDSNIGILGKIPASGLALHPISLPCAVNDSLPARIFSSRMSQSGRDAPMGDSTDGDGL